MRLLLLTLLLCVMPVWAQWGGDSRFYRTAPIPREDLVIDLDFSQFTYASNIYTIRNMANAAAPAYMYGGFDFNSVGSDSSGLSRDPHTGRVVMALDGSAGDSAIVTLAQTIDSLDWQTHSFGYGTKSLTQNQKALYASRLDTSGTSVTTNYSVYLEQRADTLLFAMRSTDNQAGSLSIPAIFTDLKTRFFEIVQTSVTPAKLALYVNNDSVAGLAFTGTRRLRRANKIRLGGQSQSASYKNTGEYFSYSLSTRALSSAERLALYNNSLRGIHSKKKFSRW